jgi:hypothetical protein
VEWGQGGVAGAIEHAQVVSCSEASWRMLGLSFAGWNAVISGLLAAIAAYGATLRRYDPLSLPGERVGVRGSSAESSTLFPPPGAHARADLPTRGR